MGLELFNKTNRVKELPKYNYNGKIKLGPLGIYPIQDYMRPFYKPFEKIGVIVRRSSVVEDVEPEVQKILSESTPEVSKEVKEEVDSVSEESVGSEVKIPEVNEDKGSTEGKVTDELVTEESTTEKKIYTEEELREMKMDDIKKLLEEAGVDMNGLKYKKDVYIEALVNAQK